MSDPGAWEEWCKLYGLGKPNRRATRDVEKEEFKKMQPIKDNYGNILDNKNRLAQIYGKIRKTENDTDVDVLIDSASDLRVKNKTLRKSIEDTYKQINPELAALREEEREKVEKGMDPRQAQKERREAVKAYYNKKSHREM